MAIHPGHEFKAEHGYTGSAHPHKDHRPKIHGYKYGGGIKEHEAHEHTAFVDEAKDHFNKGGHVDHDGKEHMHKASYDEHGFQHVKHGGSVHKHGHHKGHKG